jgi:undecaprenyl-diphosphatase
VDSSFPSDHTLVGSALAAPLVWRRWRLGLPLLVVALLAGMARVAAGVHWPSDIIGTALVALALGGLALPLTRAALAWLPRRVRRLTGLERRDPSPAR